VARRDNDAEDRQAKVLTKDEARGIAVNIASCPSCCIGKTTAEQASLFNQL
jgi:hypothetical protein